MRVRMTLVLLGLAIAAALPMTAAAGSWSWPSGPPGRAPLDESGSYGPSCVFGFSYPGGSPQCSGWNTWAYVQAETFDEGGTIGCGFQTYGTARERRVTTIDRYCFATPGELGMPSYVVAYARYIPGSGGDDDNGAFGPDVVTWINSTT